MKTYPIEQAVQAQKALRAAAGLGPEMFPLEAFVGMISDEIQQLREQGKTNQEIANVIEANPDIKITALGNRGKLRPSRRTPPVARLSPQMNYYPGAFSRR